MGGPTAVGERPLTARYALDEVLARGGVGVVWRGRDLRLGRPVAVKLLHGAQADPHFRARFLSEAQHAARLSHPNIAAVYDYGEEAADGDEPTPFLVMELVEGESLADLLSRRGRLGVGRTLSILRQLSSALATAHEAGVVHRDVKPANVLVRPDGVVKITDFGIAASAASAALTETGQVVGTARYLSPEQARGRRGTPASDVYALGLVGYECLAGRPAFDGPDPIEVAAKQVAEPPPPLPPDVPEQVRGLVGTATAKDPAHRIPDGAALRDALDRVLESGRRAARTTVPPHPGATAAEEPFDRTTVGGARPLPPVPVRRAAPRRQRWWVVSGGGALLCGLLSALVLLAVGGPAGSAEPARARVGADSTGVPARSSGPGGADGAGVPGPAVAPDPATGAGGGVTAVPTGAGRPGGGGQRGTARGAGGGGSTSRSRPGVTGSTGGAAPPSPGGASATAGGGSATAGAGATGTGPATAGPTAGDTTAGTSGSVSTTGSGAGGSAATGSSTAPAGASSTGTGDGTSGTGTAGTGTSATSGTGTTGTGTSGTSGTGTAAPTG